MVRLDGACFASKIDTGETIRDAAKRLNPFLSCEEELDHQLSIRRSSSSDAIVAFPAPTTSLAALRTRTDVDRARNDGVKTAWCTLEAIKDSPTFQIAAEALMRAHGMAGKSPFSGFKVGVWDAPKPIVACRGSRAYEKAVADPQASERWHAFLQDEREHAEALRIAFSKCEATTCFADVKRQLFAA
mmetsp:Transcript_5486/g.14317  ORF Transcript_5486/g.14317 Transcript_5486/m.14317 type:complete len:187 (+) Transcript_5486:851-1411(+)